MTEAVLRHAFLSVQDNCGDGARHIFRAIPYMPVLAGYCLSRALWGRNMVSGVWNGLLFNHTLITLPRVWQYPLPLFLRMVWLGGGDPILCPYSPFGMGWQQMQLAAPLRETIVLSSSYYQATTKALITFSVRRLPGHNPDTCLRTDRPVRQVHGSTDTVRHCSSLFGLHTNEGTRRCLFRLHIFEGTCQWLFGLHKFEGTCWRLHYFQVAYSDCLNYFNCKSPAVTRVTVVGTYIICFTGML